MAISLKKSRNEKKKDNLGAKMQKIQDEMKAIEEEEAKATANELAAQEADAKAKVDLDNRLKKLDSEIESLQQQDPLLNKPSEQPVDEIEEAEAEEERIRESEGGQLIGLELESEIDLNKEELYQEKSMVEKDSKQVIKDLKAKGKILKKEEKKALKESKNAEKKVLKSAKEAEAEQRRQLKIKKIRVTVGEKSYMVPESAIFDLSKKDYKIKEDRKKIKEGQVCVLYLLESGIADIKYVKPDNGMFIVDGMYYHMVDACNYSIGPKRIPLAVIPEWSFSPVSRKNYWHKLGGVFQAAQKLIIKSLESAEIVKIRQEGEPAKKADGKLIIVIVIAAVVGLYFLTKGSGVA